MIEESESSSDWSIDLDCSKIKEEDSSQKPKSKNEKEPAIIKHIETQEERVSRFKLEKMESKTQCGQIVGLIDKMQFVIKIEGDKILDIDTLLFTNSEILGRIEDIFGSIHEPMYTVLSDGYLNQLWDQGSIKQGDQVFFGEKVNVVEQDRILNLMKLKGSDASNMFDEEITHDEQDYSDDEKEKISKSKNKDFWNKKKQEKYNQMMEEKNMIYIASLNSQNFQTQPINSFQQTQQQNNMFNN